MSPLREDGSRALAPITALLEAPLKLLGDRAAAEPVLHFTPLGLTPGPNPHSYVPNPHVLVDPLGLEPGSPLVIGPARTADELRNSPGVATGGESLPPAGADWLKGSHGNAGRIPGQLADQLRGQSFQNFREFKEAFWKAVAKDPGLSARFTPRDIGRMGHLFPMHAGGGVYDMKNIAIVTPKLHTEILNANFRYDR